MVVVGCKYNNVASGRAAAGDPLPSSGRGPAESASTGSPSASVGAVAEEGHVVPLGPPSSGPEVTVVGPSEPVERVAEESAVDPVVEETVVTDVGTKTMPVSAVPALSVNISPAAALSKCGRVETVTLASKRRAMGRRPTLKVTLRNALIVEASQAAATWAAEAQGRGGQRHASLHRASMATRRQLERCRIGRQQGEVASAALCDVVGRCARHNEMGSWGWCRVGGSDGSGVRAMASGQWLTLLVKRKMGRAAGRKRRRGCGHLGRLDLAGRREGRGGWPREKKNSFPIFSGFPQIKSISNQINSIKFQIRFCKTKQNQTLDKFQILEF